MDELKATAAGASASASVPADAAVGEAAVPADTAVDAAAAAAAAVDTSTLAADAVPVAQADTGAVVDPATAETTDTSAERSEVSFARGATGERVHLYGNRKETVASSSPKPGLFDRLKSSLLTPVLSFERKEVGELKQEEKQLGELVKKEVRQC